MTEPTRIEFFLTGTALGFVLGACVVVLSYALYFGG